MFINKTLFFIFVLLSISRLPSDLSSTQSIVTVAESMHKVVHRLSTPNRQYGRLLEIDSSLCIGNKSEGRQKQ
jgi:hypothetical protein